jgi:hypothetical protein
MGGIIRAINGYRATAWRSCNKFSVLDGNLSIIGQMNDEWLKWLSIVKRSDLIDGHGVLLPRYKKRACACAKNPRGRAIATRGL